MTNMKEAIEKAISMYEIATGEKPISIKAGREDFPTLQKEMKTEDNVFEINNVRITCSIIIDYGISITMKSSQQHAHVALIEEIINYELKQGVIADVVYVSERFFDNNSSIFDYKSMHDITYCDYKIKVKENQYSNIIIMREKKTSIFNTPKTGLVLENEPKKKKIKTCKDKFIDHLLKDDETCYKALQSSKTKEVSNAIDEGIKYLQQFREYNEWRKENGMEPDNEM